MLEIVQDVTARVDLSDIANQANETDSLRTTIHQLRATIARQQQTIDRLLTVQGIDKEEIASLRASVKRWERRNNQYEAITTGVMKMIEEKV